MRISGGKLAYHLATPAHASILYGKEAVLPETALSHECMPNCKILPSDNGGLQGLRLAFTLLARPTLEPCNTRFQFLRLKNKHLSITHFRR
jgi:hypothetical protein